MVRIEDDVKDYLASIVTGIAIKKDLLGPSPDDQIVVRVTGGDPTIRSEVVKLDLQIVIRAKNLQTAQQKAVEVYNALHNKGGILANFRDRIFKANHPPIYLTQDDNARHLYVVNFTVYSKNFAL
jgi:hypothetical protein